MDYKKNIFCLEGDWETDLRNKFSIQSALHFLDVNLGIHSIYKTCGTYIEFETRVKQLCKAPKRYKDYSIFYFAFHGEESGIHINGDLITLDEIMENFEGKFTNRIVHFGSCKTLLDKKNAMQFLKKTGAKAVSGFSKNVDFIPATAFDILYFEKAQNYIRMKALKDNIFKKYKGFCNDLGFQFYH